MAYFEPTSSERRGLIVLCAALLLMLLIVVMRYWDRGFFSDSSGNPAAADTLQGGVRKSKTRTRYYACPERVVETFDFDPNTADSTELLRLGFPPFMVRNIYKYRANGGRYHEPTDVRRIYGMTNELWERLSPHIRIDRKYQYVTDVPRNHLPPPVSRGIEATPRRDTIRYPIKLLEGQTIPLNEADTNALKKIPGIGSYYARQITRYREALGGYVSLGQLQEIEGMPADVEKWLYLGDTPVRRIDVNHATKNQLVRHPYLRIYHGRAIWDYRHNFGNLRSIDDLRALPGFTEEDVERLRPYLTFE